MLMMRKCRTMGQNMITVMVPVMITGKATGLAAPAATKIATTPSIRKRTFRRSSKR